MRIWILTQYYPPEFGAVAVRLSRLAHMLADDGHDVTVLTAMPNYPSGVIPETYRGQLAASERDSGVRVERVRTYTSPDKSARSRLLTQVSFMWNAALRGLFLRRPDVILVESHPLQVCLTGGFLRRVKRAPMVLNVSDLWPESAVAVGALRAESRLVKLAERVEKWAYHDAAHVVAMTEGVRRGVEKILPHPERISLIVNAVDLARFRPGLSGEATALRNRFSLNGHFTVGHIGNMSLAHDFELILDVAERLPEMSFVLAGGGSREDEVRQDIRRRGLRNVMLTGILPHDDMPGLWAATDACLIAFRDHALFEGALPSKMFEAMATGTPVVAAARGEAARLIEQTGAGITVPVGDRDAMIAALRQLAASPERRASMSRAGRLYAEAQLSPERVKQSFLIIFEQVTGKARQPAPVLQHDRSPVEQ